MVLNIDKEPEQFFISDQTFIFEQKSVPVLKDSARHDHDNIPTVECIWWSFLHPLWLSPRTHTPHGVEYYPGSGNSGIFRNFLSFLAEYRKTVESPLCQHLRQFWQITRIVPAFPAFLVTRIIEFQHFWQFRHFRQFCSDLPEIPENDYLRYFQQI